jgi:serine/threonine-protein kinase
MTDDPRVQELLDELLSSHATPEEVCASWPDLLPTVRNRWRQIRRLRSDLDALFPPADQPVPQPTEGQGLPQIPGYELEAVLGRGGKGIVFRARHVRLKRVVALKMLLDGAYATPQDRARFQREAEAVAGVRHPHIVQVYDVGEHESQPYFTMELVEGGSLAEKLTGTPQPRCQAAALIATLATAVHAAHQSGIVHRDLKPGNVLLTAEGTPKISDFGLARRLESRAGLTQSGAPFGTPSYMAPEQARGKVGAMGPAVDVYALGAILYELLTGRPPFKGETPADTVLQVVSQEVVPPSRLNATVPRDLETICLKCLQKDSERRYPSAAALADDLTRFGEGRPIQARPVGWAERLWRWCRRRPAAAALAVAALVLFGLALAAARSADLRQAERRMETARQDEAISAALEKTANLEQEGRWPEAGAVLEGAQRLLSDSTAIHLVERVNRALVDADMVAELEQIRLHLSEGGRSREPSPFSPEQMYAGAFQKYGIPVLTLEPVEAAARIRNSAIHETLLAFMHDWLYRGSDKNRARLREVLDQTDDDSWRHAFREALLENDAKKLAELAKAPGASVQPAGVVSGLAAAMIGTMYKYEAQEFMRKAQQRHPGDFWINYLLGCFWWEEYPQEAVGYLRAAVAIRPASDGAYLMLGQALRGAGDSEGAIAAFRQSVAHKPGYEVAKELVWCLAPRGELEEARAAWEKFLECDPPDHEAWYGYAQLCLFLGNREAYRRARRDLLKHFGSTSNDWVVAERTSLACMLLPDSGDELKGAIRLADLAVAGGKSTTPGNLYLQFVKGLALYRDGRPKEAIPLLQEAAGKLTERAGPRLALAMAQFQSGSAIEARKTLAGVIRAFDWDEPRAGSQADLTTYWVNHVLRREAEAMILPNLPAFLEGHYQPQENDERIALLGVCQSRGLYGAAAQLYADAFAADPRLADDMTAECYHFATLAYTEPSDPIWAFNAACRYLAARCAALAGCGLGKDGARLSEAERTHWRKQARAWLQDDLAMWAAKLDSESPLERNLARRMLTHWQANPDLAGLREPQALDELSADERKDCSVLWHEVRALLKQASQYRATAAPDPARTESRPSPSILMRLGRLNEAWVVWKSALKAEPLDHSGWYGYAELCLFLGHKDEYRRARRDLLERFGATTDPYVAERVSRACLLMPATGDELQKFVSVARRAVATNSVNQGAHPYFEFVRGLAEFRQGQFDRAISAMRGAQPRSSGPPPRWLSLWRCIRRDRPTKLAENSPRPCCLTIGARIRCATFTDVSCTRCVARPRASSCQTCKPSWTGSTNLRTMTSGLRFSGPASS